MSADSELAEFKQPTIEEIMALVVGWSVEEKAKLLARIIGNNLGLTVVCGDSDNAAKSMAFQVSMMPVSDYPDVLRAIAKQIESHSLEQKRRQLAEAIASHLEYGLNDDLSLFLQRSASLVCKASNPKQILKWTQSTEQL